MSKIKFCPLCNEMVSKSTFYNNKDLYCRQGDWYKEKDVKTNSHYQQQNQPYYRPEPTPTSSSERNSTSEQEIPFCGMLLSNLLSVILSYI